MTATLEAGATTMSPATPASPLTGMAAAAAITRSDPRGCPVNTRSQEAIDHVEKATRRMLSYFGDPLADLDAAIADDPAWMLPHLMKANCLLTLAEHRFSVMARDALREGIAQNGGRGMLPREHAHLAATVTDIWAAASKDYDSLLFGAPRLVRFLTISGKEFLPSQGTFRPIVPEVLDLARQLQTWGITREQLVDLGILVGTDFNPGVRGIGPKTALKLVRTHGRIEAMPADIRDAVGDVDAVRDIYLHPDVVDVDRLAFGEPDRDGILDFLCRQREFAQGRVAAALERAFPQASLF